MLLLVVVETVIVVVETVIVVVETVIVFACWDVGAFLVYF